MHVLSKYIFGGATIATIKSAAEHVNSKWNKNNNNKTWSEDNKNIVYLNIKMECIECLLLAWFIMEWQAQHIYVQRQIWK